MPFWHGGYGRLKVGDFVLPPKATGAPSTAAFGADGVCRRDRVYVTTDFTAAWMFAGLHPSGRGAVYAVLPVGEILRDPDCTEAISFECEKARVMAVKRLTGKEIKKIKKAAGVCNG